MNLCGGPATPPLFSRRAAGEASEKRARWLEAVRVSGNRTRRKGLFVSVSGGARVGCGHSEDRFCVHLRRADVEREPILLARGPHDFPEAGLS